MTVRLSCTWTKAEARAGRTSIKAGASNRVLEARRPGSRPCGEAEPCYAWDELDVRAQGGSAAWPDGQLAGGGPDR